MDSLYGKLAQAMVDAINAASLENKLVRKVTAMRQWLYNEKQECLDGVLVLVIFRGVESTKGNRASDLEAVQIDVGIIAQLGQQLDQEIDVMFKLIDQISGVLRRPFNAVNAGWQGRASEPAFDVKMTQENRLFRAATTYTYLVYRDVHV